MVFTLVKNVLGLFGFVDSLEIVLYIVDLIGTRLEILMRSTSLIITLAFFVLGACGVKTDYSVDIPKFDPKTTGEINLDDLFSPKEGFWCDLSEEGKEDSITKIFYLVKEQEKSESQESTSFFQHKFYSLALVPAEKEAEEKKEEVLLVESGVVVGERSVERFEYDTEENGVYKGEAVLSFPIEGASYKDNSPSSPKSLYSNAEIVFDKEENSFSIKVFDMYLDQPNQKLDKKDIIQANISNCKKGKAILPLGAF